jgi:hypothetical protein
MIFIYQSYKGGYYYANFPALKLHTAVHFLNVTRYKPLRQQPWMIFPGTKIIPNTFHNFHPKQPTALQAAMQPSDTSTPSSSAYPSKTPMLPVFPLSDADNNRLPAARLDTSLVRREVMQ